MSFFSTHKDSDEDSDEEATDRSQKPNSSRYEKFNNLWLKDYSRLKHNSEN